MRLIDADRLLKNKDDHDMISTHIIYNLPTVDAIPVDLLDQLADDLDELAFQCKHFATYVAEYDSWIAGQARGIKRQADEIVAEIEKLKHEREDMDRTEG